MRHIVLPLAGWLSRLPVFVASKDWRTWMGLLQALLLGMLWGFALLVHEKEGDEEMEEGDEEDDEDNEEEAD